MKNATNAWRLHNMLLNNQWINDQIKTGITQLMETNDNNNSTLQNVWNAAKAMLRAKYIAIQAYLRRRRTILYEDYKLTINKTRKTITNEAQSQ